jgi:beta-glucanase (GH16 family)
LVITAAPCSAPSPLPYCSGVLTSRTRFFQRYGYFEMRARLPHGRGLWPAFWLLPKGGGWPPEIDVMEVLGHDPATLYASVHWKAQGNESITNKAHTADLSAGFHIYGLSWHPDLLRWYVDGMEVARTSTPPGLDKPMYLLVNLAVGGKKSWPGAPDAGTVFPARMIVDYIRAYRD